ncbi:hypothetical protein AKJ65_02995 [candidate division MSBL1 archaeon SCGC-AAA259E19]|uniref:DUF1616 domain-containing protein n=1 Tax=candidate division MSBL1 archaeon SCGC-AAA259E19 TaxID=1698264 RepID=A0A133UL82_9EURY|nr:hypothetical protein AKJ65_02995 [candidate division MSBL1 archaeon SCGC-AAA259E19]
MKEKGITKNTAIGVIVVVIVIAAVYALLTGGGGGELNASNLTFCKSEPQGFQDYEEKPNATYSRGDKVWIYAEIDNVRTETVRGEKGKVRIWVTTKLVIEKDGSQVKSTKETGSVVKIDEDRIGELFTKRSFDTSGLSAGNYTLKLVIRDKQAGASETLEGRFTIE